MRLKEKGPLRIRKRCTRHPLKLRIFSFSGYRCHVCEKPMHKECIALLAKCGSPSLPELPPRPSLHQRMSSISLMETNNNAGVAANADYVNTNIEEHSW